MRSAFEIIKYNFLFIHVIFTAQHFVYHILFSVSETAQSEVPETLSPLPELFSESFITFDHELQQHYGE